MTKLPDNSRLTSRSTSVGTPAENPSTQTGVAFAKSSLLERAVLASEGRQDQEEAFQQLLSHELQSRPAPAEPTRECLTDLETLDFVQGGTLAPDCLSHIEQCAWCQSMLVGVVHTGDGFWQELRRRQAEAESRTAHRTVGASSE